MNWINLPQGRTIEVLNEIRVRRSGARRRRFFVFLAILSISFACSQPAKELDVVEKPETKYYSTGSLVEVGDLVEIMALPNVKVIDFRKDEEYQKGHIPGAINLYISDISSTEYPFNGMRASRKKVEKLLGSIGINSKDQLVIYDANGACEASRLWWLLEHYGHRNAMILNGGWQSWTELNGASSFESPLLNPATYSFPESLKTSSLANFEQVSSQAKERVFLDARSKDEFEGMYIKKGAFAAGHIPESVNIDWVEAVNYSGNMKFKSFEDLQKLYTDKGLDKDKEIVIYCHSGVRSSLTYFVLTQLLGYQNVKNYDGSWIEYSFNEMKAKELNKNIKN